MAALAWGDQWKLSDRETNDLAEAIVGCSEQIPINLVNAIGKHGAPLRLLFTSGVILYPRIQTTIEMRNDPQWQEKQEEKRRRREQARRGFATGSEPPPARTDGFAYADAEAGEAAGVQPHTVGVRTNGTVAPAVVFAEGGFRIE